MDEFENMRALWGDFPRLSVDRTPAPFERRLGFWSATAQFLYDAALLSCGPPDIVEWQRRLCAIEEIADRALDEPADWFGAESPHGLSATAELQPSLAFAELHTPDADAEFPTEELYGSLALWLLLQAYKAARDGHLDRAKDLQIQATLSIGFSFGEGGFVVGVKEIKQKRSASARVGATASHKAQNERKAALMNEYASRPWASKNQAARELAKKYHFVWGNVREWLIDANPFEAGESS